MSQTSSVQRVYLLNHTHVDLGFTDHVEALWPFFDDVIVRAMDLIEATSDYPAPARFRHTCEVVCIAEHFLEHASSRQIDRFLAHAKAGRIDIGAMWAHFTPIVNRRQMAWTMQRVQRLRDEYGLHIVSAMNNDVNGLAWTWVDALLDGGITGFTMGINAHRGGSPRRPRGYQWRGPSGRDLLTWCGEHYNWGRWYGLPQDFDKVVDEFDVYLQRLHQRGYDYPFAYLQTTGELNWGDNNWPSEYLSDFVRRWNDEGRSPQFEIVTLTGFLDQLRAHGDTGFEVMQGDWSDWWAFSVGAYPRQTSLFRQTQQKIEACYRLIDRVGDAEREAVWHRDLDKATRLCLLFAEHTFAADEACDRPDSSFTEATVGKKAGYIADAAALVERTYQQLAAVLRHDVGAGLEDGVIVNVNDRPLSRRIQLTRSYARPTVQNQASMIAHDAARADEDGFETATVTLQPGEVRSIGNDQAQQIQWEDHNDGGRLASDHARLTLCPKTGAIIGWHDALGQPVIALNEAGLNSYVYEWVDHDDGRSVTWISSHGWDDGFGHQGSADVLKRRAAHSVMRCEQGDSHGDKLLRLHVKAPGTDALSITYRLHPDGMGVDITDRLDLPADTAPRSIYFNFAPSLSPCELWYDAAGAPTRHAEQWPGSCHDYVCLEHWAAAVGSDTALLLLTPDAPMMHLGGFNYLRCQREPPPPGLTTTETSHLVSWPVNNHWEVNHPIRQTGPLVLRYTVRILQGTIDGASLHAAACELGAELRWLPYGRYDPSVATAGRS